MNTTNSGRTRRCKNNIRQLAGLDDCFDGTLLSIAIGYTLEVEKKRDLPSHPPRCDLRLIHCYAVGIPWHELQQLPRTVPGRRVARSLWLPFTWSVQH
uniref:Uncharacterized protein n=1 Tax=Timema bartmani TaxID=61472 RepID=A0A7R9F167_9NEOP|nr:unnamed protein product [Timema bartmani]